ncbi:PREDICTED: LOC110751626 [Prunus dulcis]|uniref:PREDICTED: LOC110751626 n=2 Tax=Prunus dulcis TaxID=3755 RepID=A0A5E4GKE0_PRUDU|nr:PREDICTED: LOC110751626 [Prunus dulcis]
MVNRFKESLRADKTSSADPNVPNDLWQLLVDGESNHKGAGAGIIISTRMKLCWSRHHYNHTGPSSLKQQSRVRGATRWPARDKGAIDQEASHLLKLLTNHQ